MDAPGYIWICRRLYKGKHSECVGLGVVVLPPDKYCPHLQVDGDCDVRYGGLLMPCDAVRYKKGGK